MFQYMEVSLKKMCMLKLPGSYKIENWQKRKTLQDK